MGYARRNWPAKVAEYNEKEEILGKRNSYSKTDPDATFMRMKDDHMRNGQLKPGYNLQISTSNQYILHYSLHPNPNDSPTLIPHLEGLEQSLGKRPGSVTTDAGYGSEENYLYLEQKGITSYVKYNTYDITKKTKRWAEKYPFAATRLHYNREKDLFYCPMGQPMRFIGTRKTKNRAGHAQLLRRYQAIRCEGCPLRARCHKSKYNRIIEINFRLKRLRKQNQERLNSEEGLRNRKQRPVDVEPVFAHLKYNRGFNRFNTWGKAGAETEMALLAIAHNIKKLVN